MLPAVHWTHDARWYPGIVLQYDPQGHGWVDVLVLHGWRGKGGWSAVCAEYPLGRCHVFMPATRCRQAPYEVLYPDGERAWERLTEGEWRLLEAAGQLPAAAALQAGPPLQPSQVAAALQALTQFLRRSRPPASPAGDPSRTAQAGGQAAAHQPGEPAAGLDSKLA